MDQKQQLEHASIQPIVDVGSEHAQSTVYECFPEPQQLKCKDPMMTQGRNKSKRGWKIGIQRSPAKNNVSRGSKLSWEEKKERANKMKELKEQIKEWKAKKIEKRKLQKEARKLRDKQRQYNQIKSGKFEVIKNPKNIKKWSKKMKSHLIKLPAEMFESVLSGR